MLFLEFFFIQGHFRLPNVLSLLSIARLPSSHSPAPGQPAESTETSLLTHGMEFVLT
jgi:hypothetical protein